MATETIDSLAYFLMDSALTMTIHRWGNMWIVWLYERDDPSAMFQSEPRSKLTEAIDEVIEDYDRFLGVK